MEDSCLLRTAILLLTVFGCTLFSCYLRKILFTVAFSVFIGMGDVGICYTDSRFFSTFLTLLEFKTELNCYFHVAVFLEKLIAAEPVKRFSALMGLGGSLACLQELATCLRPQLFQSNLHSLPFSVKVILILFSHVCLTSGFHPQYRCTP